MLEQFDGALARGVGSGKRSLLPKPYRAAVLGGGSIDSCEHGS
jgi:hypothetical protein